MAFPGMPGGYSPGKARIHSAETEIFFAKANHRVYLSRPSLASRAQVSISISTPTAAMSAIIQKIEQEQVKTDVPEFRVGDTVKVHTRVREGNKERIQIFTGIVIARRGSSLNEAFTVRKISYGEGVERTFQLHSPLIAKIEISHRGKVRRARLHYLRSRVGKQAVSVKSADRA